ncbi:MAG TPA: hypothetical protein VFQ71_13090 [Gaiellales bacterium]|jgi:hypothetical protein|nr:hypothetical protein [Gaiellales bacterium]
MVRYVKLAYRAAGIAAVVLPVIREAREHRSDPLLRDLLRPDPAQALESLGFWVERRRSLPIYRLSARREAEQMIGIWQTRAIEQIPQAPMAALASGRVVTVGGQIARYHAGRFAARMARLVVLGTVAFAALAWLVLR